MATLLLAWPTRAQAQDSGQPQPGQHRAGLVIVHGDGSVDQQCVSFAEETISGYELLQRAQPDLSVEAGAIGATVCAIGGEGCSYPQQSCFCQCQGSPCVYWSYWRLASTGWQYQNLGAGNTQVQDGDVEGWRWAAGTMKEASQPPAASFAAICGSGAANDSGAANGSGAASGSGAANGSEATGAQVVAAQPMPGSATPEAGASAAGENAATSVLVATATAAPLARVVATAAVSGEAVAVQGQVRLLWAVLLGLVVLPVAALTVLAYLRRRSA